MNVWHRYRTLTLALLLVLASLGLGVFCVAALSRLNQTTPAGARGMISGAFYLCWGTGYFAAPLCFGWLPLPAGWQAAFVVLGVFMALTAAGIRITDNGRGRSGGSRREKAVDGYPAG